MFLKNTKKWVLGPPLKQKVAYASALTSPEDGSLVVYGGLIADGAWDLINVIQTLEDTETPQWEQDPLSLQLPLARLNGPNYPQKSALLVAQDYTHAKNASQFLWFYNL